MSTPEDYWATRLHAAVDEHPGALAFDVPSYVAAGRRRVRRNRAAALVATVAAVTVVAAVAAMAGPGMREGAPPPANPVPHTPMLEPGTNGWVAIGAYQDGGDIYLVRPGEDARPLEGAASPEADESCPAWSPDGTRLLFGRASALSGGTFEKSELVIVPVDRKGATGKPIVIGLDGFEATENYEVFPCATWAPDGRWVALASTDEVWVVDTQTDEIRRLPDLRPSDLEWRPGTDQLAIAGDTGGPGRRTTSTPVTVYTVSSGELRELGSVEAALVTWSPDGTALAYTGGEQGEPDAGQLWVADSEGSDERLVVPDMGLAIHGIGPVWSPTGNRIAYQRCEADADQSPDFYCTGERHEVVLVSVADGTERVIKPPKTPAGPFYPYTVTWSPDGTTLLYSGWVNTETGEIPDGVIAVPADDPKDLTVLSDAISRQAPAYHDHRWAQTQMWGRESE